ncbi:Fic family protein [Paracidobacterium acidisoli]|uniref:Fic family protein n=1 Tax=Paracidobacterium acidisoli TaxID=2303751 RepID=A0A372IN00_9BACT|nr:Fic family protein [Paracidobacterium acidisoli]MBT9331762.1 Fic family protein [Paracidobacterium acidisoli]
MYFILKPWYLWLMLFKSAEIGEPESQVIVRIDEARNRLRHNLATPRRWTGLLRRNTFARAIRGSNSIEGYNVTAEDAIAAAEGEEPLDAKREAWLAVTGYRTAMTFVLQLAKDKNFIYSEGFIRSLHFMMLQHDLSKNPGNWRPGTIYVREEASGEIVYEGPDVEMVAGLIEELVEFLNEDEERSHALIKGAMAHLNLVMIHPFSDGNGRMARCLQTLVLAREGILESEFSSIEEYLGRNTQAYYDVLAKTGAGSWHPQSTTRDWIRFNLTAHYRQALTLLNRTKVMDLLWQEMEQVVKARGLPERLLYAICDAAIGYRVRNASYRNLAELNDIMASRDLKAAVDSGLLIPTGERRGRLYSGALQIKAVFDRLRGEYLRPIPDPFVPETGQLEFTTLS